MRDRLPTRPALVTSSRGARTLKNTKSEWTACNMPSTCSSSGQHCQSWSLYHRTHIAGALQNAVVGLQAVDAESHQAREEEDGQQQ